MKRISHFRFRVVGGIGLAYWNTYYDTLTPEISGEVHHFMVLCFIIEAGYFQINL